MFSFWKVVRIVRYKIKTQLIAVYGDSGPSISTVKRRASNLNVVVPAWLIMSVLDDKIFDKIREIAEDVGLSK